MIRRPPRSTLFPYTTLFRSRTVDPISDRFLPWVGENRTGAKGAWPPLTPHLEPADDLLINQETTNTRSDVSIAQNLVGHLHQLCLLDNLVIGEGRSPIRVCEFIPWQGVAKF